MEYGGLNPILPFLEGRSDAACRVVFSLHAISRWLNAHTIPPRSPHEISGFYSDAARRIVIRLHAVSF